MFSKTFFVFYLAAIIFDVPDFLSNLGGETPSLESANVSVDTISEDEHVSDRGVSDQETDTCQIIFCGEEETGRNMTGTKNGRSGHAGGDTLAPPASKVKRVSAGKKWEGCHYNWSEVELVEVVEAFKKIPGLRYTVGREHGTKEGTPHLQIAVHHETLHFRPMEKVKVGFHIAWVKGRHDLNEMHNYPRKEDPEFITNYEPCIDMTVTDDDIMRKEDLPEWSNELIDMVAGRLPDKTDRSIYWYWSQEGVRLKTETSRYLCYHHNAVIIQGGRKHVLATAYKNPAPIYILIVPRSDEGFVSWASLELLKDALYMSGFGTECTGMVNRKKPWVIVMANFRPEEETVEAEIHLSKDRWVFTCVDKKREEAEEEEEPDRGRWDRLPW